MQLALLIALLSCLLAVCRADARTWHVPSDAPTIQAGIDSAAAADTVLVACGTYHEHEILLKSGVTIRSETGEPSCVTVDAQRHARVITCRDVDSTTAIIGFTLTGGRTELGGGGIYCYRASPRIMGCAIVDNEVSGIYSKGGGLRSDYASPTLIDCRFSANRAPIGGAIYCDLVGLRVEGCTFTDNVASHRGGGIFFYLMDAEIAGSAFLGNSAAEGGAVYCWLRASPTFAGCTFAGNAAETGGAVACQDVCSPHFTECTFYGNRAGEPEEGSAIWIGQSCAPVLERSILAFGVAGGAVACRDGEAELGCCDVFGNAGGDWEGCIAGQLGADGNFAADPLFCDADGGDFAFAVNSPCLPGNHPDGFDCGRIGAHGMGCGPVGVREHSLEVGQWLLKVAPNPSEGDVQLSYAAPGAAPLTLSIFDVTGRSVRSFRLAADRGVLTWDGTTASGRRVAPGVYFVRLATTEGGVGLGVRRLR